MHFDFRALPREGSRHAPFLRWSALDLPHLRLLSGVRSGGRHFYLLDFFAPIKHLLGRPLSLARRRAAGGESRGRPHQEPNLSRRPSTTALMGRWVF